MKEMWRVAAIQMAVGTDKEQNVRTACEKVRKTVSEKAACAEKPDFVILPEMFHCPYVTERFPDYAEPEGGPVRQTLSVCAAENGIYLIAGSVPERDEEGKIYNTSYVFGRDGALLARHRKMHLFDIAVEGGQHFQESKTLTAGTDCTVFETEFGPMGVCICYDLRFPELTREMALRGARTVFVPAAFNMTTGPAHWEVTFRARALDNQIYLVGCAPARDENGPYVSWGHSIAVNPWGEVLGQLDEKEGVLTVDMDGKKEEAVRKQLPLLRHRRTDLYRLEWEKVPDMFGQGKKES